MSVDQTRLEAKAACAADPRVERLVGLLLDATKPWARPLVEELSTQAFLTGREVQLLADLEHARAARSENEQRALQLAGEYDGLLERARTVIAREAACQIREGLVREWEARLELEVLLRSIEVQRLLEVLG